MNKLTGLGLSIALSGLVACTHQDSIKSHNIKDRVIDTCDDVEEVIEQPNEKKEYRGRIMLTDDSVKKDLENYASELENVIIKNGYFVNLDEKDDFLSIDKGCSISQKELMEHIFSSRLYFSYVSSTFKDTKMTKKIIAELLKGLDSDETNKLLAKANNEAVEQR